MVSVVDFLWSNTSSTFLPTCHGRSHIECRESKYIYSYTLSIYNIYLCIYTYIILIYINLWLSILCMCYLKITWRFAYWSNSDSTQGLETLDANGPGCPGWLDGSILPTKLTPIFSPTKRNVGCLKDVQNSKVMFIFDFIGIITWKRWNYQGDATFQPNCFS